MLLGMARITVDVNEEWLEAARDELGTETKVATINEALHAFAIRRQARDIVNAFDSVQVDVEQSDRVVRLRRWPGPVPVGRRRAQRPSRVMAGAIYLADTSVYVLQGRHPQVRRRFETLLIEGRLAACQMTALEYLNNAPDPKGYEILRGALRSQRWLDVTTEAMDRAMEVHRAMAKTSQHRHFRLPDLIIAATAELHQAHRLALRRRLRPNRQRSPDKPSNGSPPRAPCKRLTDASQPAAACWCRR